MPWIAYLGVKSAISPGSTNARYFYASSGCNGGGGSGLWDGTTANWRASNDGTCPGNTTFGNGYDAIFGGAAGTVTIPTVGGNPLTANRIEVQTGGYIFVLSLTSGQFRTDLTSGRFTVASGVTTVYQQRSWVWTLFGAPGGTLYVDGPGTLDFADACTGVYISVLRDYVIGGGTLIIRYSGPEPTVPTSFLPDYYKLDNGSTLYFKNYSPTYGVNLGLTLGTTGPGGGTIQVDSANTVTFGAKLTGAGGLTLAGGGTLVLSADNSATFSGPVTVNSGTLNASAAGSLGSGDASVVSGVLKLASPTAMSSSANLILPGSPGAGSVNLNFTGTQTIATLYFGWIPGSVRHLGCDRFDRHPYECCFHWRRHPQRDRWADHHHFVDWQRQPHQLRRLSHLHGDGYRQCSDRDGAIPGWGRQPGLAGCVERRPGPA